MRTEDFTTLQLDRRGHVLRVTIAHPTSDLNAVDEALHGDLTRLFAGLRREEEARAVLLRAGVRAVQSTVLRSHSGELIGVLSTHYRRPRRPDERDLRLLDVLARLAADYIERARAERATEAAAQLRAELLSWGTNG